MTDLFAKLAGTAALLAALAGAPALAQSASDWDSDGDGVLTEDEFDSGWNEYGVYDSWDSDGDGMLSEDEFNTGIYDNYDYDDSGSIEEPEYGDLNDDIGDGGFWDV